MQVLLALNDNLIWVLGLKSKVTGSYINEATGSVTLYDSDSETVEGQSWPTNLIYITASNGDYYATLSEALALTEGDLYVAVVTVTGGTGKKAVFRCEARAIERHV